MTDQRSHSATKYPKFDGKEGASLAQNAMNDRLVRNDSLADSQDHALTFNVVNKMGGSITVGFDVDTYIPPNGGHATTASSLMKIGSATTGTFTTATQFIAPFGWAGRIVVGRGGFPLDFRSSKIEGNNGFKGADENADTRPDIDVSYVDGFSVPITCSCDGTVLSGCNKDLFGLGNECQRSVGDPAHQVCVNDPRQIHGPPSDFFAPCEKAAYTYDYDDGANWQGICDSYTIDCCIGTKCDASARQPS